MKWKLNYTRCTVAIGNPVHTVLLWLFDTYNMQELEVLDGIQSTLHQRIIAAFEHLCILQDCWKQLCADLDDKHIALDIDSTCMDMTNATKTISMQLNPTRLKKGYEMHRFITFLCFYDLLKCPGN